MPASRTRPDQKSGQPFEHPHIAGRGIPSAFDLAPVARIKPDPLAKIAQRQPPLQPQGFDGFCEHILFCGRTPSGEPGGNGCRSESKALGRLEKDLSAGHAPERGEGFGRNLINTAAGSPKGATRGSVQVNIRPCDVRRPAGHRIKSHVCKNMHTDPNGLIARAGVNRAGKRKRRIIAIRRVVKFVCVREAV